VDWQQGLEDAWRNVAAFVPKLIGALVILIIGLLVARLLAGIVNKVLERVGFDRAVERGGLRRALARSKYDPSDILAKVVYWAVVLFTLQLAFGVFGPNPISDLLKGMIAYLPNVFVAIVIIVVAGAIARAVTDLLGNVLSGITFGRQLAMAAGIAILVVGGFAALDQLQIAPAIVTGLWYALLAIVVGSAVVAIGGGGIPVARRYLERAASRAEQRGPELRAQVQQSVEPSGYDTDPAIGATPGYESPSATREQPRRRRR
jgi:Mechanosensitive ion channel, conserved TM helix